MEDDERKQLNLVIGELKQVNLELWREVERLRQVLFGSLLGEITKPIPPPVKVANLEGERMANKLDAEEKLAKELKRKRRT